MSVLVRGMEMPTSCHECVAGYGGCCYVAPPETDGNCSMMGKPEWCPLIPIPPHGRLIDVDELLKKVVGKFFITNYFTHICDTIAETPTVIHAENAPLDACFAEETERESTGEA